MTNNFVIGVLVVLAALGVLAMATSPAITGAHSWLTVKYQSCRYIDYDLHGQCMRIERQVPPCDPPETAFRYGEGAYGWLIRPCAAPRGTDKF